MDNIAYIEKNNAEHVKNLDKSKVLHTPEPQRKLAIVQCMDARINPFEFLGLKEGESHIVAVGGGRASDAIRSLVVSQRQLGTREIMLFHHTQCGFTTFKDGDFRASIRKSLPAGGAACAHLDQLSFQGFQDLESSVKEDVDVRLKCETCSFRVL